MKTPKHLADRMMQLRIKQITDAGLDTTSGSVAIADIKPGMMFPAFIDGRGDYLIITVNTGRGDLRQGVALTETACHYGGSRKWFSCPSCRRRCGVLYVGRSIACRTCIDLVYASQFEAPRDRMLRQLMKIRKVIGAGMEIGGPFNPPPRGMSKRRWYELIERYTVLREKYWWECEKPNAWRADAPVTGDWKLGVRVPSSRLN